MIKRLITTVLILGVFVILIKLGLWQVDRLAWKTTVLNQIEKHTDVNIITTRLDIQKHTDTFRRGYLDGSLNMHKIIYVQPRTYNKKVGAHIYASFKIKNKQFIIVNLGWLENGNVFTYPDFLPGRLGGHLRPYEKQNSFTPANNPRKNMWYFANIESFSEHFNIPEEQIFPMILYVETGYKLGNAQPFDASTTPKPRNKHLQYAIFWFGMSALWLGLSIFAYIKLRRR
jgi:surfeit locus 1 family protein